MPSSLKTSYGQGELPLFGNLIVLGTLKILKDLSDRKGSESELKKTSSPRTEWKVDGNLERARGFEPLTTSLGS
jgi:hypothetical protein